MAHNIISVDFLGKAAAKRLVAHRETLYPSTHAAWQKMHQEGVDISYYRYKQLESGDLPKNANELFGVSRFLGLGLDCWLEGYCASLKQVECERMAELSPDMQELIKGTFNDFMDRVNQLDTDATIR